MRGNEKKQTKNNFIKKELIKIYKDKKGIYENCQEKRIKTDHENERKEKVVKKN